MKRWASIVYTGFAWGLSVVVALFLLLWWIGPSGG